MNIPAILCIVNVFSSQKTLSIIVPLRAENLVGKVIWGKRLSNKLLQNLCSLISNRLILKSPARIRLFLLLFFIVDITVDNSTMKS